MLEGLAEAEMAHCMRWPIPLALKEPESCKFSSLRKILLFCLFCSGLGALFGGGYLEDDLPACCF